MSEYKNMVQFSNVAEKEYFEVVISVGVVRGIKGHSDTGKHNCLLFMPEGKMQTALIDADAYVWIKENQEAQHEP